MTIDQTTTDNAAPAPSGEQAADLAALQRMAVEGEPVPGQASQGEPMAPEKPPLEKEISGLLKMISKMVKPAFPSVTEMYSDEICDAVGNSVAPVCNKYGWLQGGIGGEYGPEIMCIAVVGPLAWATVEAAKGDIAKRREKPKTGAGGFIAAPAEGDTTPGGKSVQIGAVITP